jgi:hypothetical protein
MVRARELHGSGWSYRKIAELIYRETSHRPAATTVALWCYSESRRRSSLDAQNHKGAVRRATKRRINRRLTPEWKLERMRELRDAGLSFDAIGRVSGVWWGESFSDEQVARRIGGTARKRKYELRRVACVSDERISDAEREAMEAHLGEFADPEVNRGVSHGWLAARAYYKGSLQVADQEIERLCDREAQAEARERALREAVKFYANSANYVAGHGGYPSLIDRDLGRVAYDALAEAEGAHR